LVSTASAAISAVAPVATGNISWNIQGAAGFEQLIGFNLTGNPSNPNINGGGYGIDLGNSGVGVFVQAIGPLDPANQNYLGSLPPVVQPPLPAVQLFNAGGTGRVYNGLPAWSGWDAFDGAAPGMPTVANTNWFVFNLPGAKNGDHIDLYDYATSVVVPVGVISIIPEPMTIMLLGLGSLLLRRRK
jgi:hypothetical protein